MKRMKRMNNFALQFSFIQVLIMTVYTSLHILGYDRFTQFIPIDGKMTPIELQINQIQPGIKKLTKCKFHQYARSELLSTEFQIVILKL